MAASGNMQGALQILINISGSFPIILKLIVSVFAFIGVYIIVDALIRLNNYQRSADGFAASGSNRVNSPGEAAKRVLLGVVMTMPITFIALAGNTLIAGAAVSSGSFLYQSAGASEFQQQAIAAIFGLLAIVGYLAFGKGLRILDAHQNNNSHATPSAGIWHIVGGITCVYLPETMSLLSSWAGFDFMSYILF